MTAFDRRTVMAVTVAGIATPSTLGAKGMSDHGLDYNVA
jgi:hypothetical protein